METFGTSKRKFTFTRDFPDECGAVFSSPINTSPVHDFHRDFPPGCGPNASEDPPISSEQPNVVTEKVFHVKSKLVLGPKPVKETPKKAEGPREKVLEMLRLFKERCNKISRSNLGVKRIDIRANEELKQEGKITHQPASMIGPVPGVEIGDKFTYRIELVIVGLHRLLQGGIDSIDCGGGVRYATCIVANERHKDKMSDPNVLTYVGEGGVLARHETGVPPDQQLKGGNLGLWNSKKDKKVVRVVRGLDMGASKIVYVYDGLYDVKDCAKKKGPQGNLIFEFLLVRCPDQPPVNWLRYRLG